MISYEEKLLEFIQTYDDTVTDLIEFKIKNYDDEYGRMNEHLICKVLKMDWDSTISDYTIIEKECLVHISTFEKWCDEQYGVIFL
jgi:hypothetical protein